jgi:predicted ATP-grasp superfamily ATP-dependent carboligase
MQVFGERIAAYFNLVGLFGVDFVLTREGPCVNEINPRYTAAMEIAERLGGPASVADHLRAFREGALPEKPVFSQSESQWLKLICYAPHALVVDEPLYEWLQTSRAGCSIADLPAVGSTIQRGDPVCTLLARISPDENFLTQPATFQEFPKWLLMNFTVDI